MSHFIFDAGGSELKIYVMENQVALVEKIEGNFNFLSTTKNIIELLRVKLTQYKPTKATIGIAGLVFEEDKKKIFSALTNYVPSLEIISDAELSHVIHFKGDDGILLILGTGSILLGKINTVYYNVGGYGRIIGDSGSGYEIARKGLKIFLEICDGVHTDPIFESTMKQVFPNGKSDVLQKVYRENLEIQHLATTIIQSAENGSPLAKKILEHEVRLIEEMLHGMFKKTNTKNLPIICTGGLVSYTNYYKTLISALPYNISFAQMINL